jgi:hypothetical protein
MQLLSDINVTSFAEPDLPTTLSNRVDKRNNVSGLHIACGAELMSVLLSMYVQKERIVFILISCDLPCLLFETMMQSSASGKS